MKITSTIISLLENLHLLFYFVGTGSEVLPKGFAQLGWLMPANPELRRMRQEGFCESEATLGVYLVYRFNVMPHFKY